MVKEGIAREISSEGTLQITGGTGMFKDVKGSGNYKGTITPTESSLNWEAEVQY